MMRKKLTVFLLFISIVLGYSTITDDAVKADTKEISERYDMKLSSNDAITDPTKTPVQLNVGSAYTTSIASSKSYEDINNSQLTDGIVGTNSDFTDSVWAGYEVNNHDFIVEVNLGKELNNVSRIGANLAIDSGAGIGVADEVEVWAASSNHDYILVGKHIPAIDEKMPQGNTYDASITLQEAITANKVKLVFRRPRHAWLFISEVFVSELTGTPQDPMIPQNWPGYQYYPQVELPMTTNQISSNKSDTISNLAIGKSYSIEAQAVLDGPDAVPWFNSLPEGTAKYPHDKNSSLTDGIYASQPDMGENPLQPWFRFTRGESRNIYFDFGHEVGLSGVKIGFLKQFSKGIQLPRQVKVFLSNDGHNWMPVFSGEHYFSVADDAIMRRTDNFDKTYAARYVKIWFEVSPHIYIDEIEINGRQSITGTDPISPQPSTPFVNEYASPSEYGLGNTMLAYIPGDPADTQGLVRDVDWYRPYTAYIKDGQIKDTMFDSFLMLPYVHFLYDQDQKRPLKKADWQKYILNQFADGYHVDALNTAVGETKRALSEPDYQVSVILPLFYPVKSVSDFGEINGHQLDFHNKEDRYLALKWMVDEQLQKFTSKDYQHLKLNGFYWFTEEMDNSDPEMEEILGRLLTYIKSKGYVTSWIPYFQGSGYSRWQDIGFDLTIYQPGYAFNNTIPKARLYETAAKARQLGMGMEFEIEGLTVNSVTRFKDYLYAAARNDVMNEAVHMYYQGSVDGAILASYQSSDPYLHSLYDDTYKFIHHQFSPEVKSPAEQYLIGNTGVPIVGQISGETSDIIKNCRVALDPKHGFISVDREGYFIYTPVDNYVGMDSVAICYDYGYQQSEPTVITFEIQ